jgi:hypothetical protein
MLSVGKVNASVKALEVLTGAEAPTFGAVDAKFVASATVAALGRACKPASNPVLVAAVAPVAP